MCVSLCPTALVILAAWHPSIQSCAARPIAHRPTSPLTSPELFLTPFLTPDSVVARCAVSLGGICVSSQPGTAGRNIMAPRNEDPRPPPLPRLYSRLSHASKRSFRSHSSSFEADDERSPSISRSSSSIDRDFAMSSSHISERYPGEDTRRESCITRSRLSCKHLTIRLTVLCSNELKGVEGMVYVCICSRDLRCLW